MRLLLINPNTSASITDLVVAAGRRAAAPGAEIVGVTAAFGARYIGSRAAAAIASHAALDAYAQASAAQSFDGVMLACFGDPGLLALREMAPVPVTGMAEASCHVAASLDRRFSIITGGARWGPMLEEFVATIGLGDKLASVRTVAPTGAEIAENPQAAYALLADACNAAAQQDGAGIVILGGAGLLGIAEKIADRVAVPLLDCMTATMGALESMARSGARAPGASLSPRTILTKAPPVETVGVGDALKTQLES